MASENRTIVLSSDHVGVDMRRLVAAWLVEHGWEVRDIGPQAGADGLSDPWRGGGRLVQSGACRFGIIICGTGVGISLAANKVRGIRCVVCSEPYSAQLARRHNDANMLAFGAA